MERIPMSKNITQQCLSKYLWVTGILEVNDSLQYVKLEIFEVEATLLGKIVVTITNCWMNSYNKYFDNTSIWLN